jgi:glycosyltransferase involved in cell wall biosynthesis
VIAGNSPMHFVAALSKIFHPNIKIEWFLQNIPVYYLSENRSPIVLIKKYLEKIVMPFLDRIIVNSSFIRDKVAEFYNKQSYVFYPCINTDFFSNDHQNLEENMTLFTCSRLVKGKNIELAIKTFSTLQKNHPGLKLII